MPTIQDIIQNPQWLPFAFDKSGENLDFVWLTREEQRSAPFLDQRGLNPSTPKHTLSVTEILPAVMARRAPPAIFHSAFCCSTLMAKALDLPGICLTLKEPNILMSLANTKRMIVRDNRPLSDFKIRFQMIMSLLARTHESGETVLLKPTNAANNLLMDCVEAGSEVVIMYAYLEDFLISVLKKGEACKSFIRTQYNIFTLDPGALAGIPSRQAMTFTDLQVATFVWRQQLELFERIRRERELIILRDADFLNDKTGSIMDVVKTMKLGHDETHIKDIMQSDLFSRDSKDGDQHQNAGNRKAAAKNIRDRYAPDIDAVLEWAKNLRLDGDVLPGA